MSGAHGIRMKQVQLLEPVPGVARMIWAHPGSSSSKKGDLHA